MCKLIYARNVKIFLHKYLSITLDKWKLQFYIKGIKKTTTLTRKVTMKNENELMIEALDNFISTIKKNSVSPERFEEAKCDAIKYTIKVKKEIGDTSFLNSKEWKQFLVNQKIENIEKDFTK